MQAKNLQKVITFLQNTAKKMVGFIATLVNALKALLAQLNAIRQMLPSALLNAAKKSVQFLLKVVKEVPKRIKFLARFLKNLVRAIKSNTRETLVTMISLNLNLIKMTLLSLTTFFKKILDTLKPLERLRSAIKQVETLISAVVDNITDILRQMAAMVNIKTALMTIQKKLKKALDYIGETEKNLVKLGRAMA